MRKPNHICYIGRTRLHRSQANLIQTLQTIAGWRRLGCDVDLYLPPWPRRLDTEQHLQSMGVAHPPRLIRCPLLHPRFRFDPWVRLHAGTLRSYPIVYTRVVDISLALARAKIPHHLEIHDTRQVLDHHQIERVIAHHQTGLIQFLLPISQNAASTLLHYGAVSERLHVAPSGVDLEAFSQVAPWTPHRLQRPHIIYLGRISQATGSAIFSAIAQQTNCRVTLIGSADSLTGLPESLTLHPFISPREILPWYGEMDIALLPYQKNLDTVDSMSPVKLFEAMAAGRPIIASDLPTLREVIVHGENGLLVPPDQPEAWIQAIETLQAHPDLAQKLADAARRCAERFSWDQRASGILKRIAPVLRPIE
ncbi:MAG: glycosyltransferase family 4 protein [Verrucomicrobiota bacterium]|nr:glycosyltransferase family 4 protein [Verrucomicrobiota bacterium]